MRRKNLISLAALLLGAVGAALRLAELRTGFEPGTGLPVPGAAARTALIALTAVTAAGALFIAIKLSGEYREPAGYIRTFRVRVPLFALLQVLLGLVTAVSGLWCLGLATPPMGLEGLPKWLFAGLMVLTGASMAATAALAFLKRENGLLPLTSVIPAVFFCYWMVCLYRENAGNPVLQDYCYSALAMAASSVSFYFDAGYAYGRRNLRASVFMDLSAIFLLSVAAADPAPAPLRLALAAAALYKTSVSFRLLSVLKRHRRRAEEK